MQCDIDSTHFLMDFDTTAHMAAFISATPPFNTFVTSNGKFAECVPQNGLLLHRVIGVTQTGTKQVELAASPARYDEVMENANVSLTRVGSCQSNDFVCLGVNVDGTCTRAKQSIPIYSLQNYLDIQCTNCFLGFHTEVFFQMKITLWKLTLLSGGLRNIGINAGTVLDLTSQAAWSAAIDKKYDLVQQLVVLKFNIGPIPVRIWFEIPVEIKADARFSENAHAQVGVTGQLNIGDAYLEWTPSSHWVVHKPTPSFTWAPVLSGDANFYGHVDFAIIPTLTMHIDNLFDYSITLDPTLHLDIKGQAKAVPPAAKLCADLSYDATIVSNAHLTIDIPWLFIHEDKSWGPTTIMDTGVQPIASKCVATR